jgi:hypothetical protein
MDDDGPVDAAGRGVEMANDESRPIDDGAVPNAEPWAAGYSARLAKTVQETLRVTAAAADRWARRSLEDSEWSVETIGADVIADSEEVTPLLGRWLDLWLEAVQQPMEKVRRNSDDVDDAEPGRPDLARLVTRRLGEYADLWEGAATRFRDSSYRSEHLLDDGFRLYAKAVRDMTAGAALLSGAWSGRARPTPSSPDAGTND